MDERQQQIQQILQQALASSASVQSQSQSTVASPQLVGGMVMLPSAGVTSYLPGQLTSTGSNALMSGTIPPQCVQPLLIRHGVVTSPIRDTTLPGLPVRSPSLSVPPRTPGATIHHMGTGDMKELPFAQLRSHLQAPKLQLDTRSPFISIPERRVSLEDPDKAPMRKRLKLEGPEGSPPPVSPSTAAYYRRLYMECREQELTEIKAAHHEHVLELIFLEKFAGNLMDFPLWAKRPNLLIGHYLQAESLDAADDFCAGEEKQINNEVKVVTTSGSTIPIVTPVAIATTLPPAITALQHQGGVPLSTTAATTTVGSPPPYTMACSVSSVPPLVMNSSVITASSLSASAVDGRQDDLASILGFDELMMATAHSDSVPSVAEHILGSLKAGMTSVHQQLGISRQASTVSLAGLVTDPSALPTAASHEAVVEQARQEAQVLQRISELRRQGMWSARRLPKVQEPSRCKSHWDYVLSEMRWLAVDFAQERRWKIALAKKVAHEATRYRQQREDLERLKHIQKANAIAGMIKDFWAHMVEMAYYKRRERVEQKHSRLLQFVLSDISPDLADGSDTSEIDSDDGATSYSEDEFHESEISDLIKESEMSLDELLAKYTSSSYESTLLQPLCSPDSPSDADSAVDSDCDDIRCLLGSSLRDSEEMSMNSEEDDVVVKTYSSLQDLVQSTLNVQPPGTSLDIAPVNLCPLSLISRPLREYQLIGVDWLTNMYLLAGGCVLADSSGLGKKIETIAFLAHLAVDRGIWGKHLIVCRAALLPAWRALFESWFPASRVLVYTDKVVMTCDGVFQILITSDSALLNDTNGLIRNRKWKCLIVDNVALAVSSALWPILLELNYEFSIQLSDCDISSGPAASLGCCLQLTFPKSCRDELSRQLHVLDTTGLKQLALSLTLRRTEADVRTQLPCVVERIVSCPLSARQQFLYTDYVKTARETSSLVTERHVAQVLTLLVNLQRISDHPELLQPRSAVTPFIMTGLTYNIPRLVNNIVTAAGHCEDLLACVTTSESSSALQDDLLAELHFLMSPGTNTEPPSAAAADRTSSSQREPSVLSLLLEPSHQFDLVYPNHLFSAVRRLVLAADSRDVSASDLSECGEGIEASGVSPVESGRVVECCGSHCRWSSVPCSVHCDSSTLSSLESFTSSLRAALRLPTSYVKQLSGIWHRLQCVVPGAISAGTQLTVRRESVTCDEALTRLQQQLQTQLTLLGVGNDTLLLPPLTDFAIDSGKLQRLDALLSQFAAADQRCLILTHSTKMLNILELFLDCRQTRYQRLDAFLQPAEHRARIVQFNCDKRLACLLMSSRMPHVSIELPDVAAVVYYDSDLRPDMTRHCQQFCQSLALSRDLHIFRLVSSGTIDHMLLPSSRCDNVIVRAIKPGHGSQPSTAMFNSVDEFLTVPGLADDTMLEHDMEVEYHLGVESGDMDDKYQLHEQIIVQGLCAVEDDDDVEAARIVETERNVLSCCTAEHSLAHSKHLWTTDTLPLKQIEMYAVGFVEFDDEMSVGEHVKQDKMLSSVSRRGGSSQSDNKTTLSQLSVAVDLTASVDNDDDDDDDLLLSYCLDSEQTFICESTGQQMPCWAPPTPPQDDSDVYIDTSQLFVYEPSVMFESQLPPVYVRKGHKRHRLDALGRKQKQRSRDDLPPVPRSLFDCPATMAQRMERNAHMLKQGLFKPAKTQMQAVAAAVGAIGIRPIAMEPVQDHPEWLIHEDWALLQALQSLQELPLNLLTASPGHIPNWDLVADIVNSCSRTFRSPKQCKNRYENVIVAREEGRAVYDPSPRKMKKASKGIYKTKSSRSMRTNQLHVQDNQKASTTLFTLRFDAIKAMAAKRTPPVRPQLSGAVGAGVKNTKHLAVLAENGINYEHPLSPVQVASMRAERIAKEKKTAAAAGLSGADAQQTVVSATAAGSQLQQQRAPAPPAVQQQQQQLVLQPQQQTAAVAPTGHVILQPGQQLISAGQQVLASVDGRTQQMTIVQAPQPGSGTASLLPGALIRASAASAIGGTSVMTTMPLGRGLGIIVSQAISGQTFAAALNKGQTVVAPLQGQNAAQLRSTFVRSPFVPKDSTGTITVVSQSTAVGTLPDGTKVMTTTSLPQTQLVVTQQKPGGGYVAMPSSGVQQQLLSLSMAQVNMSASPVMATTKGGIPQVQLMRQKVIQQMRPAGQLQLQQQVAGSVAGAAQKTVTVTTTPLGNQAQMASGIQLRMQHGPQIQALIRRPQPKTIAGGLGAGAVVQQIQVSKGQILEGVQIQQVPSSLTPQTVATLMKSVSSAAAGGAVPNVSLAGANTINVSIGQQQKLIAGKPTIQPQQIRQIQMQKRPGTVQIQAPQKVTGLQQVAKLPPGSSSVIFRPQQVVVQQMVQQQQQQLIKQAVAAAAAAGSQQQQQQQPVHHIISSIIPVSSAAGTPPQLVGSQATGGPMATVSIAVQQQVAKTLAVTFTTATMQGAMTSMALTSANQQLCTATTSAAASLTAASVKLLNGPGLTTFVRPVRESTPGTGAVTTSSVGGVLPTRSSIQPVLVRPSSASQSTGHITVATLAGARQPQPVAMPSLQPGVQQTVQDIVQQAQAQAARQSLVTMTTVAMTTASDASPTIATMPGTSGSATAQSPTDPNAPQNKSTSFVMRLRNQRS